MLVTEPCPVKPADFSAKTGSSKDYRADILTSLNDKTCPRCLDTTARSGRHSLPTHMKRKTSPKGPQKGLQTTPTGPQTPPNSPLGAQDGSDAPSEGGDQTLRGRLPGTESREDRGRERHPLSTPRLTLSRPTHPENSAEERPRGRPPRSLLLKHLPAGSNPSRRPRRAPSLGTVGQRENHGGWQRASRAKRDGQAWRRRRK